MRRVPRDADGHGSIHETRIPPIATDQTQNTAVISRLTGVLPALSSEQGPDPCRVILPI